MNFELFWNIRKGRKFIVYTFEIFKKIFEMIKIVMRAGNVEIRLSVLGTIRSKVSYICDGSLKFYRSDKEPFRSSVNDT